MAMRSATGAGACHEAGCVNDPYGVCYFDETVPLIDLTPYLHLGTNVSGFARQSTVRAVDGRLSDITRRSR